MKKNQTNGKITNSATANTKTSKGVDKEGTSHKKGTQKCTKEFPRRVNELVEYLNKIYGKKKDHNFISQKK